MMKPIKKWFAALSALAAVFAVSCEKEEPPHSPEEQNYERVMIYYGCGQNDLDYNLQTNLKEMTESEESYVPGTGDGNAIVAIHHSLPPSGTYAFSGPTNVTWIYRNGKGETVRDTIARYQFTTISEAGAMRELLSYVQQRFNSKSYGIVFSSHGTGWMPQGSYDTEDTYDEYITFSSMPKDALPQTSFGQERVGGKDYFIDITDIADAIPMKPDYIIFDSCLMGGVEVAYELRGVTSRIGFSQAEVLKHGFHYPTMTRHLLQEGNPQAVLEDTFKYYNDRNSTSVISYIDCTRLQELADVCRTLFDEYRSQIDTVNADSVQQFFREDRHWFYDLEDILVQSGVPDEDLAGLREALDKCVLYKAHTKKILASVTVRTDCGLSMFLPCKGSDDLKTFYKTLAWNEATGLVK